MIGTKATTLIVFFTKKLIPVVLRDDESQIVTLKHIRLFFKEDVLPVACLDRILSFL